MVKLETEKKTIVEEYENSKVVLEQKNYKHKIVELREKYEKIMAENDIRSSFNMNQVKMGYENRINEALTEQKKETEKTIETQASTIKELEGKLSKLRQDFKVKLNDCTDRISDLNYEVEFVKKQLYQKQGTLDDAKEELRERSCFYEDQIEALNAFISKIEKENQQTIEQIKKNHQSKINELTYKYEREKVDFDQKVEEATNSLREYYTEKMNKIKDKYKGRLQSLSETTTSTIEHLSSKLNVRNRQVKNQKSEISSLKMQVKYMDSTVKMFPPTSHTPSTPSRSSTDGNKKTFLLRPASLNVSGRITRSNK